MMNNDLVMFLDFDGVLHKKMTETFEYTPNLITILKMFPNLSIVISSDWRGGLNAEFYSNIFGEYANRVIGETSKYTNASRQNEILDYVGKNGIKHFFAVDDDCRGVLFHPTCPWLFKTNYYRGLDSIITQNLIQFIKTLIKE